MIRRIINRLRRRRNRRMWSRGVRPGGLIEFSEVKADLRLGEWMLDASAIEIYGKGLSAEGAVWNNEKRPKRDDLG